jgi:hypothetical protein
MSHKNISAAEQPSVLTESEITGLANLADRIEEADEQPIAIARAAARVIDKLLHAHAAHLARQSPAPEKAEAIGGTAQASSADLLRMSLQETGELAQNGLLPKMNLTQLRTIFKRIINVARSGLAEAAAAPVAQEVEPGSAPAAADEVRDAALEDAAQKCESREHLTIHGEAAAKGCAREIRALKTTASASTSADGGAA